MNPWLIEYVGILLNLFQKLKTSLHSKTSVINTFWMQGSLKIAFGGLLIIDQ